MFLVEVVMPGYGYEGFSGNFWTLELGFSGNIITFSLIDFNSILKTTVFKLCLNGIFTSELCLNSRCFHVCNVPVYVVVKGFELYLSGTYLLTVPEVAIPGFNFTLGFESFGEKPYNLKARIFERMYWRNNIYHTDYTDIERVSTYGIFIRGNCIQLFACIDYNTVLFFFFFSLFNLKSFQISDIKLFLQSSS